MRGTVTTAQMKAIDEAAIHRLGIPSLELMECAATHTARAVLERIRDIPSPKVTVVCGTGNNGGDGLACARLLREHAAVTVLLAGDPARCTPDSLVNGAHLRELGVEILPCTGEPLPEADCIVDAVFGFGLNREVTGLYRRVLEQINASPAPVIACDIPSGLNGDTGKPMGIAVRAHTTVTFTRAKIGLTLPGAERYVGRLLVADIGIPEELIAEMIP